MAAYNNYDQLKMDINDQVVRKEHGPITCLGISFSNENERRKHFTELLREKLKDPEFRNIEGFPDGEDEDILILSDPPYYTTCPNPWIRDFIEKWEIEKPLKTIVNKYYREPFASDVSEGKNHPIYNAHSYHTKVPHKAIMRYILHYTDPNDIVFDGFCGTGMTGVAAQLCGDRNAIFELGYQVKPDGSILKKTFDSEGIISWVPFSKIGPRKAVLNDLSPAATIISSFYNGNYDPITYERESYSILSLLSSKLSYLYETKHTNGAIGTINYTVWSEIYICPSCLNEFDYYSVAFKESESETEFCPEFNCPNCNKLLSKNPPKNSLAQKPDRKFIQYYDQVSKRTEQITKRKPVLINYRVGKSRFVKVPDKEDIAKLERLELNAEEVEHIPLKNLYEGDKSSDPFNAGVKAVHQFYSSRTLKLLANFAQSLVTHRNMQFLFGSILPKLTIMNRYMPQHGGRALVGPMANTLYVPPVNVENNVLDQIDFQIKKIIQAISCENYCVISTQSIQSIGIPNNSMDYAFIDPPFGSNIMYSELSLIREAWLNIITNQKPEAIESKYQKKPLEVYGKMMENSFKKIFNVLKPGRWMTVEFSNTNSSVWVQIQSALANAGFIVANVSGLDKTRGGFHSMVNSTSVKKDLVISAYKPDEEFENRFKNELNSSEGVWDFIRSHLKYLPLNLSNGSENQFIPERDPRILYDQTLAYYIRKGLPVPISSQEFQISLAQRFVERDGMYFLPEQIPEYDKKKMISGPLIQMDLVMSDESTAIDWLRHLLREKPQTFAELNPQFLSKLGGWSKYESNLDLRELLSQNFIIYNGKGPVPEQIHTYLSTNWREYRNLSKEDPSLVDKAKDRWYVPDPNKAGDLEKIREKALLREFEEYKQIKRKFKTSDRFRIEAVRAGFRKAWQDRDYMTIVSVAEKIPSNVIEEDPKLLMWYDQALTRLGR